MNMKPCSPASPVALLSPCLLSLGVLAAHHASAAPLPAGTARPARATAHPGYFVGEGFAFTFSVGAIDAGRARISVGGPTVKGSKEGERIVAAQADGHSAPWLSLIARLDDDYRTTLDADTFATRSVNAIEHGLRERRVDMVLEPVGPVSRVRLHVVRPGGEQHGQRVLAGTPVDPIAALFLMRAAPLADDDRLRFIAFDGPVFYRCDVRVAGHDKLERGGAALPAIRLEMVAHRVDDRGRDTGQRPRYATIWLSDDARRIPYRVGGDTDFGRCELELVSYREGTPPPAPPPRTSVVLPTTADRPSLAR